MHGFAGRIKRTGQLRDISVYIPTAEFRQMRLSDWRPPEGKKPKVWDDVTGWERVLVKKALNDVVVDGKYPDDFRELLKNYQETKLRDGLQTWLEKVESDR